MEKLGARLISTTLSDISQVANDVRSWLRMRDYNINAENTSKGYLISASKGGFLKAMAGLRTAFNINLSLENNRLWIIVSDAGQFGEIPVPTIYTVLAKNPDQDEYIFSPSNPYNDIINMIEAAVKKAEESADKSDKSCFCHACGKPIPQSAGICPLCGAKQ